MVLRDTFGEFYFTPTFVRVFHMCISACSVRVVAFENCSVSVSRKKINLIKVFGRRYNIKHLPNRWPLLCIWCFLLLYFWPMPFNEGFLWQPIKKVVGMEMESDGSFGDIVGVSKMQWCFVNPIFATVALSLLIINLIVESGILIIFLFIYL